MELSEFPVGAITIPSAWRAINSDVVDRLAESIERIGLKFPIHVSLRGEHVVLVSGLHRLEAFKKLGRTMIPGIILREDDSQLRIWYLDENLCRSELTKLERGEFFEERVALSKKLTGKTNVGKVASEAGISDQTVYKARRGAREISEGAKKRIKDDSKLSYIADKGVEIEALSKLTLEEETQVLDRVSSGASQDVRSAIDFIKEGGERAPDVEAEVRKLLRLWERSCQEAQEKFRQAIGIGEDGFD